MGVPACEEDKSLGLRLRLLIKYLPVLGVKLWFEILEPF
jgi:hypothetical protein